VARLASVCAALDAVVALGRPKSWISRRVSVLA
jgi:hypothetical protein